MEIKYCHKCNVELSEKNWYKSSKNQKAYYCKDCIRVDHREYYIKNRTKVLNRQKEYAIINTDKIHEYDENRKVYRRPQAREYYYKHRDIINARYRNKRLQSKIIVVAHYSNYTMQCNCCGESNIECLTIDHINGNGGKHRRDLKGWGKGSNFYRWLINNNFPKEYQILCFNCNLAKGHYGYCPHKRLNKKEIFNKEVYKICKNYIFETHTCFITDEFCTYGYPKHIKHCSNGMYEPLYYFKNN